MSNRQAGDAVNAPQADKSNQYNLYGELRVYQKAIMQAAADAPLSIRNDINGGVSDVIYALEQLTQRRAQAVGMYADPRYSRQEQFKQANDIMSKALAAAQSAIKSLDTAAASARKQLEASLLPKAPKSVEEVTILDRKQDLTLLLRNTVGTPDQKIAALSRQLRTALQTGDDLTAYVLTQRMSLVYQAVGMNSDTAAQAFAAVLGESTDDRSPLPGALLLSSLQRGGANTVAGFLSAAGLLLYRAQEGWVSFAKQMTA